jgi:hypothetical protein
MLYLIRGLPGAGKSWLADTLAIGQSYAADDYFMKDGVYLFNVADIAAAHLQCQERTENALRNDPESAVAVANTFTQRWELEPYLAMAERHGAMVTVIDLYDGGYDDTELARRNSHGVPVHAIQTMRTRYEHNWRKGNPLPPWERVDNGL